MTKTQDMLLNESTEQLRAKASLQSWIEIFLTTFGQRRKTASKRIREMASLFPWLGDLIPDEVWNQIYLVDAPRARAVGTVAPFALMPGNDNDDDGDL